MYAYRKILSLLVLVVILSLAACSAATPQVVEKVVEKVVTQEVEKEVIKTVEVEKVVEKEVVVTATPEAAAAPAEELSDVQELRVIEMADWRTAFRMNPFAFGGTGVADLMWLRMAGIDPQFQAVNTGLAESWDIPADHLSVTLHLRKDLKFSDGSPITAKEAAWSLGYYLMNGHKDLVAKFAGSNSQRYWSNLKGAKDVFDGKVKADEFGAAEVEGVKVVDDYTITLEFTQPSMVLSQEPLQMWYIIKPESVMAGKDKEYGPDAYWPTEKDVVTSGPWMLESFAANSGMTLTPNPNWVGAAPKLSRIISTFLTDPATAMSAFENKEADVVLMFFSPMDADSMQSSEYLKSSLKPVTGYDVNQLLITAFKPMEDVNVRRAIAMAIDRQALADVLGGGSGQLVYTPLFYHHVPAAVPTCNEQFAKIKPLAFDPAKAKEELAKSPYASKLADMEINFTLGMWGEPLQRNLVETQVIQKMLEDNLGVKNIKIHQEPMADYTKPTYPTHLWPNSQGEKTVDVYSFMMNLAPLSVELPDEAKMTMLNLPYSPDLVAKMKEAGEQSDPTKMCEKLAEAQQIWVDQVFTLDLFNANEFRLVAPWVKNINVYGGNSNYTNVIPGMEETYIIKH